MIFTQIYLYPDLVAFPHEFTAVFRDQTRYICNFIGREIAAIKYQHAGFKRLCVIGSPKPRQECAFVPPGVLSVEVDLSREEYETLCKEDLPEYFLRLLTLGFDKAAATHNLPIEALNNAIAKLRALNFRNTWIHSEKSFRGIGLKCALLCELSIEKFTLTLVIKKGDEVILDETILTTPPDEVAFEHKFKELKYADGKIAVVDKFGRALFEMPYQSKT